MRVLTWNLFHGRAVPAAPRSLLRRVRRARSPAGSGTSRCCRRSRRGGRRALGRARGRRAQRTALTSRNALLPLRRAIADRRPDLIKSNGGGANAILVRGARDRRAPRAQRCAAGPSAASCHARAPRRRDVGRATSTRQAHSEARAQADIERAAAHGARVGGRRARSCSAATSTSRAPPSPGFALRRRRTASTTSSSADSPRAARRSVARPRSAVGPRAARRCDAPR